MGHQLVFYFALLDVNFQMLRTTANPVPLKHDFTLTGVFFFQMNTIYSYLMSATFLDVSYFILESLIC
jgi:hypothetical protein